MSAHKFHLGQMVAYNPQKGTRAPRDTHVVTAALPERHGQFEYRIRCVLRGTRAHGAGKRADGKQRQCRARGGNQGQTAVTTGPQIKAARVLLGWSVRDLARRAAIEIADVQDIENAPEPPKRHMETIRAALEDAGIQFIDSVGVELRPVEIGRKAALAGKGKR